MEQYTIKISSNDRTIQGQDCKHCDLFYLKCIDFIENTDYFYLSGGDKSGRTDMSEDLKTWKIVINEMSKERCLFCYKKIELAYARMRIVGENKNGREQLRCCAKCRKFYSTKKNFERLKDCYDVSTVEFLSWVNPSKKMRLVTRSKPNLLAKDENTDHITTQSDIPTIKVKIPIPDVGREWINGEVYCDLLLSSTATGNTFSVYVTSGNTDYVHGKDRIVSFASEMGKTCAKAIVKHINLIHVGGVEYRIVSSKAYNPTILERIAKGPQTVGKAGIIIKPMGGVVNYSQKCPQIHVFYSLTNSCMRKKSNHIVESLTMSTINGKTDKPCNINVYHCKTCGKYFVNNEALQKYNSRNIYPLVRFTLENDFSGTFRPNSILSIYGYTVKEGELTGPQRHRILAYIVDSGVITKAEAIKTIQQFVHLNGKKAGNQNARKRWEEDIQFLSQYTKGNVGSIAGQFVYHNN